jgi:Ni/Co efflux regulator RcnB
MKKLLASLAAVSLLASPAFAQTNTSTTAKTTKTTKATHASSKVAKDAKAEHESVATEKKEVKAAAKHHYGKYHRCGTSHMKGHHKAAHHATHKAAAKTTKSTTTATKTSG